MHLNPLSRPGGRLWLRMRLVWPVGTLCLILLAACGGGGGVAGTYDPPPTTPIVDLGILGSTSPSRTETSFTNPLAATAIVTAGPTEGPFSIDPTDLPATAPPNGRVTLGVLYDALGEGPTQGTIRLVFTAGSQSQTRTYELEASGERVTWALVTSTLDFGAVEIGATKDLEARALNLSSQSPVTLSSVSLPSSDFSVVGNPFPMTVSPGMTASVTIRYAPLAAGIDDGTLTLGPQDVGASVRIPILAGTVTPDSEQIVEFGSVNLDSSGRTPSLTVSVPADAISLTLEAKMNSTLLFGSSIGLYTLTGPGDKVYENASSSGNYIWIPGVDVFSTSVPNSDQSDVQLVSGGGTYTFRLRKLQGIGSSMTVRAIIERRTEDQKGLATLDLNVWLADGITPTAATASSDTRLQAVLTRIDQILETQGISIGDVDYYDVDDASYDTVTTQTEFAEMLQTTSAATENRLNLFFVEVAFGGGVVGVSATISGPKLNGTGMSGVMAIYDGYSTSTIGLIAAHEIGHFVGLYHTVEQDGSHDFIDDTLECPSSGTDSVCTTPGGGYLMHWQAVGGSTISDGQALVIRGHPHMQPRVGGDSALVQSTSMRAPTDEELSELLSLPQGWCGTCEACRKGK